jgi:hydroxyacylglutathione hydrolase
MVIDPSEYGPIHKELQKRNLDLKFIVITHEHIDHVLGVQKLRRKYRAQLCIPQGANIPGTSRKIVNGNKLTLGDVSISAMFVPGHHSFPYPVESLNNNIAWYCEKAGIAFTGDTLFSCGYGYTARGHESAMFESLKLLRSLPDETLLFFGHEYSLRTTMSAADFDPENAAAQERLAEVRSLLKNRKPTVPTTVGLEKAINPWLRWDDEKLLKALGITGALSFRSFIDLWEKKNNRE